jgi:hypothetical protein
MMRLTVLESREPGEMMGRRSDLNYDLGETWSLQVNCHADSSGSVPLPLLDAIVVMQIESTFSNGAISIPVTGIVQGSPLDGVALFLVTPATQVSAGAKGGRYSYTVRATMGDGSVSDQLYGLITIRDTEFS